MNYQLFYCLYGLTYKLFIRQVFTVIVLLAITSDAFPADRQRRSAQDPMEDALANLPYIIFLVFIIWYDLLTVLSSRRFFPAVPSLGDPLGGLMGPAPKSKAGGSGGGGGFKKVLIIG